MKILQINKYHYHKGGAERAYFDTARILEEHGHEVAFFSMKHQNNEATPYTKYFIDPIDYHTTHSIFQKMHIVKNLLWNHQAQLNLSRLLSDFQPDVAHLHNTYHQLSPSIIRTLKKHKVPIVMTLHDYKLTCPNYSLYANGHIWTGGAFRCITDRCVQHSYAKSAICATESIFHHMTGIYENIDTFIAPSKFLIALFKKRKFTKDISHIPQPITKAIHGKINSTPSEKYLLFAGRLSQEKGIDVLLHALAKTKIYHLHILGDGPEYENLVNLAKKLDIIERVTFTGHQDPHTVAKEMSQAQAVVIPSVWYENMPYSLLEPLSVGKIVIASDIGGIPERISHGENGFLFPSGDSDALSAIIAALPTYDHSAISKKAIDSVSDLSPESYYQKILKIYNQLQ